jgi:hypothetical protein
VTSLVNYLGGMICTTAEPCYNGYSSGFVEGPDEEFYASGQLQPVAAEPVALILLGTGALGLAVIFRRKLLQRAA